MAKQFGVIGLGYFGKSIAITLEKLGYKVLATDRDKKKVDDIMERVSMAKQVDAIEAPALKEAGFQECDAVVIAIGEDIEASILATMAVKELGLRRIIVKAKDEVHAKVLEKIGVERIVFPERDMGIRLANQLVSSDILEFIELSPDYSLEEIKVTSDFVGKTMAELDIKRKYGLAVIAIKRGDKFIIVPHGEEAVREGDILVLMGEVKHLKAFEKKRK